MSTAALIVTLGSVVLAALLALMMIPVLVWLERRVAGLIQDRVGPNRTNIMGFRLGGVIQSFADVIKLVFKEEYYPGHIKTGRALYMLAPAITFSAALLAFMTVPFADTLNIDGEALRIQALPVEYGILWYLAIGALGIIGVLFGGWLSHNKYSLLGTQRAGSMGLSYELPLGLAVVSMMLTYNTIDFNAMVAWQTQTVLGFLPAWGVVVQPLAFVLFSVALFAETNRAPFNVVEGESEIVSGHMTEFSAMKFALYFMGEYIAMNSAAAVIITMFFGGYQLPYLSTPELIESFGSLSIAFMVMTPLIIYCFIRWMRHNNDVRPSLSNDGGRRFEARVLSIVLLVKLVVLELIFAYFAFAQPSALQTQVAVAVMQIAVFVLKLMLFNIFFIVVRWTLPRFRFDQVQKLGWYYLLPLALLNIFITAIVIVGVGL